MTVQKQETDDRPPVFQCVPKSRAVITDISEIEGTLKYYGVQMMFCPLFTDLYGRMLCPSKRTIMETT